VVSLLITALLIVIIAGLAFWVLRLLPLPAPWGNVAQILLGIIVAIVLIIYVLMPLLHHFH